MRSLLQILAISVLSLSLAVSGAPTPDGDSEAAPAADLMYTYGVDLDSLDGFINWRDLAQQPYEYRIRFAYIAATEGTS